MFTFLKMILIGLGLFLALSGIMKRQTLRRNCGIALTLLFILGFWFMDFWGEKLWFDAIGYRQRFWTMFLAQIGFVVGGVIFAMLFMSALTYYFQEEKRYLRYLTIAVGAFIGGFWGFANWEIFLKFWFKVDTVAADPIFNRETGFYMFSLPFLDSIQGILMVLTFIALIGTLLSLFVSFDKDQGISLGRPYNYFTSRELRSLYLVAGLIMLLWAFGRYLARFHLMYSDLGAVSGPGWTDVTIILPALNIITITMVIIAVFLLVPGARKIFFSWLQKVHPKLQQSPIYGLMTVFGFLIFLHVVAFSVLPGVFQSYRVEPNEITFEKPYIANNIEFTKLGFKLDQAEEREFEASETISRQMVVENQSVFDNIRLWDWRALDAVLKQFQEIRLYYEFRDVDIDRYRYDGQYRAVMVSAREMEVDNLPVNSQTFVNQRFKYTHGYGIALTTVSGFTSEGLPNLLVKDIPPKSEYEPLKVEQPRIYYGELTDDYVIVNSSEQEFDYPSGSENVYTSYQGKGGIVISSFWRKLIYSYKMGDAQLLLSSYPRSDSKIMFKREIRERVSTLAPFLQFDEDPYIVNAEGKLYWMLDAYTTTSYYPYSEKFAPREIIEYKEGEGQQDLFIDHRQFAGINYMRNPVKVVINAFDGTVDFYLFDPEDPIIQVWSRIFPGLFKDREEMPEQIERHIRYPADYLLIQGLVYAKYHMKDPEVFYNQEDLWIRATEKYYNSVIPVQPYYIMWQLPKSTNPEFSLILPFTPKNRQVLIGWIAGMCDPENYGRFLAYNFPKAKRILGPQQVETKIDQDSFLSGQLSLWDQRGSRVIRGNVLAIPIENTLIYVEPIYLQAETAAYPELRLVCVMHEDNLSYAETFDEALAGIFGTPEEIAAVSQTPENPPQVVTSDLEQLISQANDAFENYLQATGAGEFDRASRELEQLRTLLSEMNRQPADTLSEDPAPAN